MRQERFSPSENEAPLGNSTELSAPTDPLNVSAAPVNVGNVFLTPHLVPPHLSAADKKGRRLNDKDLIGLYQAIETALPEQDCRIVQFVSCYNDEGAKTIGTELSILVAQMVGRRTLFIGKETAVPAKSSNASRTIASLNDVANGRAQIASAIAESPANALQCDYAYIASGQSAENILGYLQQLQQILTLLRNKYDLIVFHAADILADPMGVSLGRLADGAVLVVEAERTRAPAAKQALRYLQDKGVRVIGLAFNKRRYYIPRWLYRSL